MSDLLTIAAEVFAVIPGLRVVVAHAEGMSLPRGDEVEAVWRAAWSRVHSGFGFPNPQSHPHVEAWRRAMKAAGASHKDYPTSVEALARRALKSPQPFHVNPYVDFYNAVSLDQVVPAGGYDLDSLPGPLELRLTRAGDSFQALDAPAPEDLSAGELAYVTGSQVVTRHLVWRQSRLGLVTAETRSALFLSELLPPHHHLAGRVERSLVSGLVTWFGATVHTVVLSSELPDC